MKFGIVIPHNWGIEDSQEVIDITVRAEEIGFDSVWINHHVVHAGYIQERLGNRPYFDGLTVLTYVAALTKTIRLGTSVLVLPYLNPLVLAKTLTTLDVMSGGRLVVGVGVGALPQESEALGSDYTQRGAYTDESIAILKELWTQDNPSFSGKFFGFSGIQFWPKPNQKPHPPIQVGGASRAALRRVARVADGWHPTRVTAEDVADGIEYLKRQLESAGRKLSEITITVRGELNILDAVGPRREEGLGNTPDRLLSAIDSLAVLGVSEVIFQISTDDADRFNNVMETFATQVMPKART